MLRQRQPGANTAVASPASDAKSKWDLFLLAVAGMILSSVWRLQDLYPILATIQFPMLVALVALGIFVADRDPRRKLHRIKHPVFMLAVLILGIMILSVPGALYPGKAFAFIKDDFSKTFLMMVLIAVSIRTVADVRRYTAVLVVGATLYSYYILTKFVVGPGGRLSGLIYYDANDFAMMLVCTIPLAVYFLSQKGGSRAMRVIAFIGLVFFVMSIVRSGSRGGFLGLIGVTLYLLFGYRAIKKQTRWLAVLGGFVLLQAVAGAQYWEMMSTLLNPKDDYNWSGGGGRSDIWKRGMVYMIDHPFLGVGVSNFQVAEGSISPLAARQELGRGLKWSAAHNSFVEIGAEMGVIALAAFTMMLFFAYRTVRTGGISRRRAPPGTGPPSADAKALGQAIAGSLVGYLVAGFFLSQAHSAYLYVLLGMTLGMAKLAYLSAAPATALPVQATRRAPLARRTPGPRPVQVGV